MQAVFRRNFRMTRQENNFIGSHLLSMQPFFRKKNWTFLFGAVIISLYIVSGCSSYRAFSTREFTWQLNAPDANNPIFVSAYDHEFLWAVLVDVVDSHFEIARETPVRLYGNVLTEGRLDTKPKIGASLAELWHADSVGLRERFDCTLQTIRRRVMVRVVPEVNGYQIEVFVYKELEDKRSPLRSPASIANLRFQDDVDGFATQIDVDPSSTGWIMVGRDVVMEERLLREINYRLQHPSGVIRKSKEPIRG